MVYWRSVAEICGSSDLPKFLPQAAEGSADGGVRALPLRGVLRGCAAAAVPSRVLRVGHGDRGRMFQAWICCVTNVEMWQTLMKIWQVKSYIYMYIIIYIYCILSKPKKTVSQLCFWKHFTGFMGLSMSLSHNEGSLSELHSRIGTSKTCSVKSKSAAPLSCCETVPWNNRYNRSQRKSVVLSRDLSVLAVFQSGNKPQNEPQNQPQNPNKPQFAQHFKFLDHLLVAPWLQCHVLFCEAMIEEITSSQLMRESLQWPAHTQLWRDQP